MNKIKQVLHAVAVATMLLSCAESKYVPDGSYLLNNVEVTVAPGAITSTQKAIDTRQLRNYTLQRSNSRWFSAVKLPLRVYSLSGRDSTRWINRTLRAMGERPVIFDSIKARLSTESLTQELHNEGFLDAKVGLETKSKGKKLTTRYILYPGEPYYLGTVKYDIADSVIANILGLDMSGDSRIKEGQLFNVGELNNERKRITNLLNDQGYYRFHKEYISFSADSSRARHTVDIVMHISPFRINDDSVTLHPRYHIGSINYYSGNPTDSIIHLRKSVLMENTQMAVGHNYSASSLRNTYNHFGRLGAVKYTDITFRERQNLDTLDCDIRLQTNKPSTLSFQPEGTNTAGDLGAAASLTYQNRNLFRGSENLSIELRGAYEAIRGLEGYRNQDFTEYSIETRLVFPRFIMPFLNRRTGQAVGVTSEVSLLYDSQDRPEFHRRVLSTAWRYKWSTQSRRSQYQLDVLDLNYVFMPWISETFRQQYLDNENSRNAILRYNYEDLFITKLGFGYSFNNGKIALKTNIESSGNVLNLGSRLTGASKDSHGQYRLFNIAYAQYVKADVDLTRSIHLDYGNDLVFHIGIGVAYPYGNSTVLPFEKRYFSGGANSVRGWSVRSLGPGKFKGNDGRIDFINQTGDMKLDINAEYRAHLFWKLGGALFIDAGNIWTLRNYREQPGGQFSLKDLPTQIAASYGVGLRFNFDYFIVRFDLGMKAINPAYEEENEEHYPLFHPRFSRDYAFHFAVGLPF